MKKIIAMLLAVAMVAALGVAAFAGTVADPDSKTETFTVAEWADYLANTKKSPATVAHEALVSGDIRAYAAAVSSAKAVYAANLAAYNAGIKVAAAAVQFAQYATVADYVYYATELYAANVENAINEAVANFYLDLADELGVDFADIYSE